MEGQKIVEILQKSQIEHNRIIKKLFEKRIQKTPRNKFDLQEIYYYSNYFNVTMNELLLEILVVDPLDYQKFIHEKIKYIQSKKYQDMKNKYLKNRRTILKYRINWNKRIYYTKSKLLKYSELYKVNVYDFSINVLEKSKRSTYRVLNDKDNRKRLYIGQNIDTKLPKQYFEENINEIQRIIKIALKKAFYRRNLRLTLEDYKDQEQKCLIYIMLHGNCLKKDNTPVIVSSKYKKRHGKIIYCKVFYYILNEITKIKKEVEYNDKIAYNLPAKNDDEFELLESVNFSEVEKRITKLLIEGYKMHEILKIEEINEEKYNNIFERIRYKLIQYKLESRKTNFQKKKQIPNVTKIS